VGARLASIADGYELSGWKVIIDDEQPVTYDETQIVYDYVLQVWFGDASAIELLGVAGDATLGGVIFSPASLNSVKTYNSIIIEPVITQGDTPEPSAYDLTINYAEDNQDQSQGGVRADQDFLDKNSYYLSQQPGNYYALDYYICTKGSGTVKSWSDDEAIPFDSEENNRIEITEAIKDLLSLSSERIVTLAEDSEFTAYFKHTEIKLPDNGATISNDESANESLIGFLNYVSLSYIAPLPESEQVFAGETACLYFDISMTTPATGTGNDPVVNIKIYNGDSTSPEDLIFTGFVPGNTFVRSSIAGARAPCGLRIADVPTMSGFTVEIWLANETAYKAVRYYDLGEYAVKSAEEVATSAARESALTTIATYLSGYDRTKYTASEWTQLQAAYESGRAAITAATSVDGVNAALAAAKAAMDAVPATAADLNQPPPPSPPAANLNQSPPPPSITDLTRVKVTVADRVWTGRKIASGFDVRVNGKKLALGADYTVTATGANKNIGKGTVTLTGKGKYGSSVKATFNIVPKAVRITSAKAGKKSLTVTWAKAPKAEKITKYQVRWKIKGAKKWSAAKAVSPAKVALTVKNLKKGKKYQVQARAYKAVKGVKYYSAWSTIKTSGKTR
jgi:hypothetical protein